MYSHTFIPHYTSQLGLFLLIVFDVQQWNVNHIASKGGKWTNKCQQSFPSTDDYYLSNWPL